MEDLEMLASKAIIKRCSSKLQLSKLLDIAAAINNKQHVLQLFDPASIIDSVHLSAAYINCVEAFKEHTNRANSMAMELMLFTAMTDQISRAISLAGAKNSNDFILFCDDKSTFNSIRKYIDKISDFCPSARHVADAASSFGIAAKDLKHIHSTILHKMALSMLE